MAGCYLDRDPSFWDAVANHPEVAPYVFPGSQAVSLAGLVANPAVYPLRSEHGGFLFCRIDSLGRIYELHTLFTPEGWGREVHGAAKDAFSQMFGVCDLIVTSEVATNPRSRPPKSFGFVVAAPYADSPIGRIRTWILTREAWENSPARRRLTCLH